MLANQLKCKLLQHYLVKNKRMFHSFILSNKNSPAEIVSNTEEMIRKCKEPTKDAALRTYTINNVALTLYSSVPVNNEHTYVRQTEYHTSCLIGRILNEPELKRIAMSVASENDSDSVSRMSGVNLISYLYEKYGASTFNLPEGTYTYLTVNHSDSQIEAYTDKLGMMPLYYTSQLGSTWLFNEAKLFASHPHSDLKLKSLASLNLSSLHHDSDFSVFERINKLAKGHSLVINKWGKASVQEKYFSIKPHYFEMKNAIIPDSMKHMLHSKLEDSIRCSLNGTNEPGLGNSKI